MCYHVFMWIYSWNISEGKTFAVVAGGTMCLPLHQKCYCWNGPTERNWSNHCTRRWDTSLNCSSTTVSTWQDLLFSNWVFCWNFVSWDSVPLDCWEVLVEHGWSVSFGHFLSINTVLQYIHKFTSLHIVYFRSSVLRIELFSLLWLLLRKNTDHHCGQYTHTQRYTHEHTSILSIYILFLNLNILR